MVHIKKCNFAKMTSVGRTKRIKKPSKMKKILESKKKRMEEWKMW